MDETVKHYIYTQYYETYTTLFVALLRKINYKICTNKEKINIDK